VTEADVWRVIISTLRSGLDSQGLSSVLIKQSFQPIKQGVDSSDTVYLFKVSSRRYGFQGRTQEYNQSTMMMDVTEKYWMEAVYQLTPHVERNIQDSSSLTSYDIADTCSAILQSKKYVKVLIDEGIGIQIVQDIRNPFDIDDYERFDQDANLDFTISYLQNFIYSCDSVFSVDEEVRII